MISINNIAYSHAHSLDIGAYKVDLYFAEKLSEYPANPNFADIICSFILKNYLYPLCPLVFKWSVTTFINALAPISFIFNGTILPLDINKLLTK